MTNALQKRALTYLASAVDMIEQGAMDLRTLERASEPLKNGPTAKCRRSVMTVMYRLRKLNRRVESLSP